MTNYLRRNIVLALVLSVMLNNVTVAAEPVVLIDRIVAIVEDDAIMKSELDDRLYMVKLQLAGRQGTPPPYNVLTRQVLERLIIEHLQLQMAKRRGIRIDDLTLNETMQQLSRSRGISLEQFRDNLIREGIDYVKFREQVRTELITDALRNRVVDSKIQITDQEVSDFIANQSGDINRDVEYQLSHILVTIPEAASADQITASRTKAESIRERVISGESFRQLAISESDGQNALEGGNLGWRKANELPTIFAAKVSVMHVGDVSEIIRSPSGFHIIYLADRRGEERQVINQTHARHILIKTSALVDDEQAQSRLRNLKNRIRSGEDFAKLARANSEDSASALNGGDLGWTSPGDLVPEFEETLNNLQIGKISEPFKTDYGWHLVEVLGRRQYDSTEEALRAQARKIIRKRKTEEETELWLRRLRDESYVEYHLEPENQT
jgi:peptidyl-prolyl cis-trans isomerase SurA